MDWVVTVVTVATLGTLAGASVWFNGWIDGAPVHRPDGLTAVWVVIGVAYTLAGTGVLMGVWWPVLVHVGEAAGAWGAAAGITLVTGAAFGASGAPMVWGDMRRAHGVRLVGAAIAAARDDLHGATRGGE